MAEAATRQPQYLQVLEVLDMARLRARVGQVAMARTARLHPSSRDTRDLHHTRRRASHITSPRSLSNQWEDHNHISNISTRPLTHLRESCTQRRSHRQLSMFR